jgi:Protein of unknown function (DUF3431)
MKPQLVIARFNEDPAWIRTIEGWEILVDNKGEAAGIPGEISSPNHGREPETFLRYLVDHYEELPDRMAFLQGHPFDHAPEILSELAGEPEEREFRWFGGTVACDALGNPHHPGLELSGACALAGIEVPERFVFAPGGQFTLTRDRVLRRPKEALARLRSLTLEDPRGGYVLERLWGVLFGDNR